MTYISDNYIFFLKELEDSFRKIKEVSNEKEDNIVNNYNKNIADILGKMFHLAFAQDKDYESKIETERQAIKNAGFPEEVVNTFLKASHAPVDHNPDLSSILSEMKTRLVFEKLDLERKYNAAYEENLTNNLINKEIRDIYNTLYTLYAQFTNLNDYDNKEEKELVYNYIDVTLSFLGRFDCLVTDKSCEESKNKIFKFINDTFTKEEADKLVSSFKSAYTEFAANYSAKTAADKRLIYINLSDNFDEFRELFDKKRSEFLERFINENVIKFVVPIIKKGICRDYGISNETRNFIYDLNFEIVELLATLHNISNNTETRE